MAGAEERVAVFQDGQFAGRGKEATRRAVGLLGEVLSR
jgi:hypothetical protein